MRTYIYQLKLCKRLWDDEAWSEADNKAVEDHFFRLQRDFDRGIVVHVGRTIDPANNGFGIVIFKAENDALANAYMNSDPAVAGKQMTAICLEYKTVLQ